MEATHGSIEHTADREIVATRVFDAPRDLVFRMWTDPAHIVHWWGPNGFTTTIHEMDVRPGGMWRFIMHGPDGVDYPQYGAVEGLNQTLGRLFEYLAAKAAARPGR